MTKPVVIGLGNELFGDDGFGPRLARRLGSLIAETADVVECRSVGLALLDPLVGRPRAVILDAICTGRNKPGTILRLTPADLRCLSNLSPHYVGLPEVLRTARRLELPVPSEILIIAVEAGDVSTIGAGLSPEVEAVEEEVIAEVVATINRWQQQNGLKRPANQHV